MSIARHHAEWLWLIEASGPFLSMPVLLRAFPQGLDAHDPDVARALRLAYDEWQDNQKGLKPDPAIHTAWIRFVLDRVLELPDEVIAEGQAILPSLKADIAEHGETLRPDIAIVDPTNQPTSQPRLLIQVHPSTQDLDKAIADRRWKASPTTRMMELLHATGVRLGLVTNGDRWMLVDAPRGETTGFASWHASLWNDEPITLRAFRSLLSVHRFFSVSDDATLEALLAASATDQHEVTNQLGYQVRRAVEVLVQAIDRADQDRGRTLLRGISEAELYETALTVMMRLVFLLSAEERSLLLLGDPVYDQYYAVSTLRAQLREAADQFGEEVLERRHDAWCRLLATFRAVHGGINHPDLKLPAYGGSLFDPDRYPFLEGRMKDEGGRMNSSALHPSAPALAAQWRGFIPQPLPVNNRVVLHLLEALQVLQVKVPGGGPAEARRLSFRALDIEQIGTVYEGLLDHTAVRASEPVLGLTGTKNQEPEIPLPELEAEQSKGEDALVACVREMTGRSESALRKAVNDERPKLNDESRITHHASRLRAACGNDEKLYQRVLPFAGLIRDDDFGLPVVIRAGSVYVTTGATRRQTQTHYTPRSLTELIVQRTLEPLVYIGPAEGLPRDQWRLRTPAELLALKICDMAIGSASFHVQADRHLAELLVEAWETRSAELGTRNITIEGEPVSQNPTSEIENQLVPIGADDRLILARRLIAERCLYGVDKNPMAVEIAKLSMWLVTLAKDRPFTFLDHAFKRGDSLVGADEEVFRRWAHGLQDVREMTLFDETLRDELSQARSKRRELESFVVAEPRDAERKAALLAEAEAAIARVRVGCDLIIGTRLLNVKPKEKEVRLNALLMEFMAKTELTSPFAQEALAAARKVRAFHWPFEFPEVFEQGGFHAFLGNPPFLGGGRVSTMYGDEYLAYLHDSYPSSHGQADICAFFFLNAYKLLALRGAMGLIATNTIAQGDTRETGLDELTGKGGEIFAAQSSAPWPGMAAVHVSVIHVFKGRYGGDKVLDDRNVEQISSYLDITEHSTPKPLKENSERAFRGMDVLGMGFTMSPEEARKMIDQDSRNADVLFPYINGQDLNNTPDQSPHRWVINFFDWPLEKAEQYVDCMKIVREKVYPERSQNNDKQRREIWWRFTRPRVELFTLLSSKVRVLARTRVTQTHAPAFIPTGMVYSDAIVVFAFDDWANYAVLQSTFHESWSWKNGSTLKGDLRYSPTDCLETFPFPQALLSDDVTHHATRTTLDRIGEQYHEHRRQIMLARQEGLTATYNRFRDPDEHSADIARLRDLHVEMDRAVAAAYGWDDLDLDHGFHETPQGVRFTISESARREVLARLLKLNHERYEEEVRQGLHEKGRSAKKKDERGTKASGKKPEVDEKKGRGKKKSDGQIEMFRA